MFRLDLMNELCISIWYSQKAAKINLTQSSTFFTWSQTICLLSGAPGSSVLWLTMEANFNQSKYRKIVSDFCGLFRMAELWFGTFVLLLVCCTEWIVKLIFLIGKNWCLLWWFDFSIRAVGTRGASRGWGAIVPIFLPN